MQQKTTRLSKPPTDPATFDPKIAAADQQLAALRKERTGKLALLNANDDAEANAEIAAIEREITAAEAARQRLVDARAEAEQRFTDDTRAAFARQLRDDATAALKAGESLLTLATRIAQHVDELRPMLQQFAAQSRGRRDLAWGVLRAAGHSAKLQNGALDDELGLQAGPLSWLFEAACRNAGLGSVSPSRGLIVPPAPRLPGRDRRTVSSSGHAVPVPGGRDASMDWHTRDPFEVAREGVERANQRLAAMLEAALAAAGAKE